MPTTSQAIDLRDVPERERGAQLLNSECTTCRQTAELYLSTAYSRLLRWVVNTTCGHSKLCLIRAWCPVCGIELIACKHCGRLPYEHTCTTPRRHDSAALIPPPGAAAL